MVSVKAFHRSENDLAVVILNEDPQQNRLGQNLLQIGAADCLCDGFHSGRLAQRTMSRRAHDLGDLEIGDDPQPLLRADVVQQESEIVHAQATTWLRKDSTHLFHDLGVLIEDRQNRVAIRGR